MAKTYKIKEMYFTIQGEGFHTGTAAVFCRFSGCNLWSGREIDREKAICKFCDTDFWGTDGENGGTYTAEELAKRAKEIWNNDDIDPFIVFTGGEPGLQLDDELLDAFEKLNFYTSVETNGTILLPKKINWVTISPKANAPVIMDYANEIKLVFPQSGIDPINFEAFASEHFYLQPMDNPAQEKNTWECVAYCKAHPLWKLSLQTHKILNIK